MDYAKAIKSVADVIAKGSKPLTEAQEMLMAGAMAVFLEKAGQNRRSMPPLTDAMRAVIRNEHTLYQSEDELYAALVEAAAKG